VLSYTLVAGNGTNDADNSKFTIGGAKGNQILVGSTAVAAGTYHVLVEVQDQGGKFIKQALTIVIGSGSVASSVSLGTL
jgi:hypothetical protein